MQAVAARADPRPPGAPEHRPDVLVIGLGPAGASAAATAAEAGCRVLAIDRRHTIGSPVQCAEFVSLALSVAGVGWEGVCAHPIRSMHTFVEDSGAQIAEDFRGRMICRAQFDQALARDAMLKGARCLVKTTLAEVRPDGVVRLASGQHLWPRVLIGADGPRSLVGAAIGQCNRELVAARQLTAALARSHDATDIFLRAAYRGGYGWLFPKRDVAHVGIGVDYQRRHELKARLADLHAQLQASGRVYGCGQQLTGGLIPVGGRLRSVGRRGPVPVLLAGDAAGLTNPVTGAGIESAVRSGQLAGAAAAEWLDGHAGAIEDYEQELAALYDGPYARALRHRHRLLSSYEGQGPTAAALQRAWIASPDYWLDSAR